MGAWAAMACALLVASPAAAGTVRVTSSLDSGRGTLRAAIHAANHASQSSIVVELPPAAEIIVESALPALRARGTRLDGGGVTLRESPRCRRSGDRQGCDGIVVTGPGCTVHDLVVAGFTFDGIAVRGAAARDVRIDNVQAIDNLDDGIGVSEGAGPVTIENTLLMGNGFRTKGKGLLVFDGATATLRDSLVLANRDGVTVSRGATATLERVLVAGNFDKGLGVSGGAMTGRALEVLANGRRTGAPDDAPNADGMRIGLSGSAELDESRIAGSGDAGLVVLDDSAASLRDTRVEANRGEQISVAPNARLRRGTLRDPSPARR